MTVDLELAAYRKAESLAAERGETIAEVLNAVLLGQPQRDPIATQGPTRLPVFRPGYPVTSEEVKATIAEDEEWEITRGNPYHPWYLVDPDRTVFAEGYPRVVDGPLGLPEVQLGPPNLNSSQAGNGS